MTKIPFEHSTVAPSVSSFAELRTLVGWKNPDYALLQRSIEASLFWISIHCENLLVATGRVVGDGAMYFYVQDVIVHPSYRGLGLGRQIMERINDFVAETCSAGTTVGLLAAQGKESFYAKFGFMLRDGQQLGLGMCRFV